MAQTLKILCVHGVGRHLPGAPWQNAWQEAVQTALSAIGSDVQAELDFVLLDDLFAAHPIKPLDVLQALGQLLGSGVGSLLRRERGLMDGVRWTAGMVVQWVENEALRAATRARLAEKLQAFNPQVVLAHSLGSLVSYDCFTEPATADLIAGRSFLSLGSQIGNPFVRGNFAKGYLTPLSPARRWVHLYNPNDRVLTAPIRLQAGNFEQILTPFDTPGALNHDAEAYLRHGETQSGFWFDEARVASGAKALRALGLLPPKRPAAAKASPSRRTARKPSRKALLVGVNEYADPSGNLAGCVNDSYLVSALLQESGFAAEDIRLVLNERATAAGLRERLEWLLDDAREGDTRVFYFCGHGAQVPVYGAGGTVESVHESLVPHDFDWSPERMFSDREFHELYSQLPYGLNFLTLLDCCHSGGMTRAPARRIRGISPPDDIRHRMLRWDAGHEMWVAREFASPNAAFDRHFNGNAQPHAGLSAEVRTTHRIGQCLELRGATDRQAFKAEAAARGHHGPYMPTLIYACQDDQFAYEYEHGAVSHGAFTYCLVKALRAARRNGKAPSFEALVAAVGAELKALRYEQTPLLTAPSHIRKQPVPLKM